MQYKQSKDFNTYLQLVDDWYMARLLKVMTVYNGRVLEGAAVKKIKTDYRYMRQEHGLRYMVALNALVKKAKEAKLEESK